MKEEKCLLKSCESRIGGSGDDVPVFCSEHNELNLLGCKTPYSDLFPYKYHLWNYKNGERVDCERCQLSWRKFSKASNRISNFKRLGK